MTGVLGGIALAKGVKRATGWLKSPVTWAIVGVLLMLGAIWLYGRARYADGDAAGAARIQAQIDAPVVGWAARLDACHGNVDVLDRARILQNEAIARNSEEADARLKTQAERLAVAQREARALNAKVAGLMRPLVGIDQCARVLEMDRRLLESLK